MLPVCLDELSILLLPVAEGTPHSPAVFEVSEYLQKTGRTVITY